MSLILQDADQIFLHLISRGTMFKINVHIHTSKYKIEVLPKDLLYMIVPWVLPTFYLSPTQQKVLPNTQTQTKRYSGRCMV